jgi:hypothetical protein
MTKTRILIPLASLLLLFASCSTEKSYFTGDIKHDLQSSSIPFSKVQFYVDRDVELRRELESGKATVTSGKVVFENGKYMQIVLLKRNTPGVCTEVLDHSVRVSFENGSGKYLEFGQGSTRTHEDPYLIFAKAWNSGYGLITYDGQEFHIEPDGGEAGLMIKKSVVNTLEVEKRTMKGVKVSSH